MRVLLDSHTLLWAVDDMSRLSRVASDALKDSANVVLVSAASTWEIAIKVRLGKLALSKPYRDWMHQAIAALDATILPISIEDCATQVDLADHHRDPFDRLLAAQALTEAIPIISADAKLDSYGVQRWW